MGVVDHVHASPAEPPARRFTVKILVCGSRTYLDFHTIHLFLSLLPKDTEIIHGDSTGADKLADTAAKALGLHVTAFPANWKEHGRAAGPQRNQVMLEEQPDVVVAFHVLPISPGTADMIARASKAGVSVLRIPRA